MAHIVEDRILEITATAGTGPIALAAAAVGFRRFSAVCAVGDTVPYFIEAVDSQGILTGDYEYGIGTYSAANQLTRTSVLGSSNAGAAVNFAAGTKNVGIPALARGQVPTGARIEFLGSIVPAGYAELDGSLKSRLQFPALWAYAQTSGILLGSDAAWAADKGKFSPGDGATTFRVPDHRGQHSRAWDHGAGVDAGRALGTMQADQYPAHGHSATVIDPGHSHFLSMPTDLSGSLNVQSLTDTAGSDEGDPGLTTNPAATGITVNIGSSGTGTETRVKTVAVLVCVKT